MFMISKFMYHAIYHPREFLDIEGYETDNHIGNFYYFRFGAAEENGKVVPVDGNLVIPKNGFAKIWSWEAFTLSERVLGLFGNLSALVHKGLQLVHSPSIDPGFGPGSLALGIKNNTSEPINLMVGENIGKILFFDVSDTFINVEEFLENALKEKQLEEREKAAEVLQEGYEDMLRRYEKIMKNPK